MTHQKDMTHQREETAATVDSVLDATGLYCPEPVMLLHNAMRDLEEGQILKVVATDPSTRRDIPKFCSFLNHDLMASSETGGEFHFLIRKGGPS